MYTKIALLALVGSASAFNAPMMSANAGRREAVAGAAGAAVVAPLLRPESASAGLTSSQTARAPVVEFFDERDGCAASTNAYQAGSSPRKTRGGKSGDQDDQMCVKVAMKTIIASTKLTEVVTSNYNDLDRNGLKYSPIDEHR
eukprot:CAMPEP_0173429980 /NCGR_PEP_ID=MMETSP1357-20121228/8534_1 /TAXON_ID=77926 /ORGANISM="Hemiselmis rufescens, Strain PCC563" /LENGTH=142 /DNA_ID=CAMNT_0014394247 /DNA_START=50 /DNA_END=478 /DNA_ORIENTATION=+